MQKVLITGISGFVGQHLAKHLLSLGSHTLYGTHLSSSDALQAGKIQLTQIDLTDAVQVEKLIDDIQPDSIFHLAALASPADSFKKPKETIINNVGIQVNILEAVRKSNLMDTKVLIVSSADIYGIVQSSDLPIDESTPYNPTNPYAVSKLTQDFLALQYFHAYQLPIIRVRPFNHIGPGQSPHFAVPTFAKKIAEIEKGKREPVLSVGNLDTKRDFTDVRDVVRAYSMLIEKGTCGDVYNIGSGTSYKMSEILKKLLSFSHVPITVQTDSDLLRPTDTPELVCDNRKIKETVGWTPEIPLEKTLKEVLDYWRNLV